MNRPALIIPWNDSLISEPITVTQEDIQAGLSALPDYVTSLSETELGILVERLSQPEYRHLLEVLKFNNNYLCSLFYSSSFYYCFVINK